MTSGDDAIVNNACYNDSRRDTDYYRREVPLGRRFQYHHLDANLWLGWHWHRDSDRHADLR